MMVSDISNAILLKSFINLWKKTALSTQNGHAEENHVWAATLTKIPHFFTNFITLKKPCLTSDDLNQSIKSMLDYVYTLNHPCVIALPDSITPATRDMDCFHHGLIPIDHLYAMRSTEATLTVKQLACDLSFKKINDESLIHDVRKIHAQAYNTPIDIMSNAIGGRLWEENSIWYVGFKGDEAISCIAVFNFNNEFLYVSFVATNPQHQCQGYGQAALRYMLHEAMQKTGIDKYVLHATEAGLALYKKNHFEIMDKYTLFLPSKIFENAQAK